MGRYSTLNLIDRVRFSREANVVDVTTQVCFLLNTAVWRGAD